MAEKITEEQVEALQRILASDRPIDEKVTQITGVKTSIKHHNVPDACVAPLFEALRKASRSPHGVLVHAGLTSLNHLLTRLSRQEPRYISHERKETLKLLVDKMGDQKDKFRAIAVQSMVTMCKIDDVRPAVEGAIKEIMDGKTVKAKAGEACLQWLLQAHNDIGLPFKTYVPLLMKLLENSDPGVRETARNTVIDLFRDSSGPAKVDLKKKLVEHNVRPATQAAILKELNPRTATPGPDAEPPAAEPIHAPRPNLAASMSSISTMSVDRPFTPAPDTRTDTVEPSYINTSRELEDMFRDMHGYFEGNESEHNWKLREQSITRLRRLLAGNAPTDYADAFLSGLRGLLDGIIKAIKSLRTSLSKEGCSLVQDMAIIYGPGMDPMVELLMQTFIVLAGATKKIASQQANVCVDAIVGRVTYTKRIMEHVTGACADKNVQPRTYASGWLKTLLQKEAGHKSHIEHGGGLELLEKAIKRGLTDANPGVREKMRSTFWVFHGIWPPRADALMDTLEPTAQRLLEKDPNNPNASKVSKGSSVRPGLGLSRSTMGTSKPSIRETLRAQKAAMSRPGSAMETSRPMRPGSAMEFSPPRANRALSNHSNASGSSAAPSMAIRPKVGGLAGAPVRPRAGTRPNIPPRPKTAGPYDIRSSAEPALGSPPQLKKAVTPRTMVGSPKRTIPRVVAGPGHKITNSGSSIPTPTRLGSRSPMSSPATSPHHSPLRTSRLQLGPPLLSNSRHEDSMMVDMPNIADVANTPTPVIQSPLLGSSSQPPTQDHHQDADMMDVDEPEPPSTVPEPNGVQMDTEPMQDQEMQGQEIQSESMQSQSEPMQSEPSSQQLKVYEDPMTTEQLPSYPVATTVLEERPVNEDAASFMSHENSSATANGDDSMLSEKDRQQLRLIDSALNKIKTKTLDVHGFRKFQGILRENKTPLVDEKFDALLLGLFDYLEDTQPDLAPEKVQDVKAQILATIKLLLKKHRDHFQPHVSKGLESLMAARAAYDSRTHIVSGLELLADELVLLGDAQEIATVLTKRMADMNARDAAGCRSLSMGLHVLKELVDMKAEFMPADDELANLAALCTRCLESSESGVRMDAVQLCVALHARAGDARFWEALKDVRDDPKSLITYYIVKRQREGGTAGA